MSESTELVMATQRGMAKSEIAVKESTAVVGHVLGPNFEVSEMGLQLTEGAEPTEQEYTEAVAFLAKNSEDLDRVKMSVIWNLGDLCLLAEQAGLLHQVVDNAVKVAGKSKHTVMQSIKLCRHFPREKRIPGFSATHHQEVMNYSGNFEDKPEILDKVIENSFRDSGWEIITPDDRVISQKEAVSCAELRANLQEACGKKPKEEPKYGRTKFLYIDRTDPECIYKSDDLNMEALDRDEFVVVSLEDMAFREIGNQCGCQIHSLAPA